MERDPCMALQEHQTPGKLESGFPLPFSQFPVEKPACSGWSVCRSSSGYPGIGSLFRQVLKGG